MKQQNCKYCGARTNNSDICSNCFRKRALIREIQSMVRTKQEELRKSPCDVCNNEDDVLCYRCPAIPKRRKT